MTNDFFDTLPGLGELHVTPSQWRVAEASEQEQQRAARAVERVVHEGFARRRRIHRLTALLAWVLGLGCAWAALEATTNTPAYITAAASLVAFVVAALRSGALEDEVERHARHCTREPR